MGTTGKKIQSSVGGKNTSWASRFGLFLRSAHWRPRHLRVEDRAKKGRKARHINRVGDFEVTPRAQAWEGTTTIDQQEADSEQGKSNTIEHTQTEKRTQPDQPAGDRERCRRWCGSHAPKGGGKITGRTNNEHSQGHQSAKKTGNFG